MEPTHRTRRTGQVVAAVALSASMVFLSAHAENIVFPPNSSVKNVVSVFGARGDGVSDDTQPLQTALNDRSGIMYLPNGTYRVTRSLLAPSRGRGPWIYGQSRDGVVIKLDDNAAGFGDSSAAQPVIASISVLPGQSTSADHFMRQWHNFTVHAGNNRGAIGVRFYSNNSGVLDNVRITGNGKYGVDMGWVDMNGPLMIQNVTVEGFAIGVFTRNGLNSQTMVGVTVRNCARYGVYCFGQNLSIEDLTVENTPVAVFSRGMTCIVNGTFTGSDPTKPAILNECCHLYCRNITTTGFSRAVQSSNGGVAGSVVSEYTSEPVSAAFTDFRRTSLNLPVRKTPPLIWEEDTSQWICVNDFGAVAGDSRDDTKAFQDAIDTAAARGKTVVCLKHGDSYTMAGDVYVHGSVRYLIGLGLGRILLPASGPNGFILRDDAAPVVRFENFYSIIPSTPGALRSVTSNNSSTLVVEHSDGWHVFAPGSGDVFINNICGLVEITNPAAHVWARQWNTEGRLGIDSDNQGGFLWIFGLKTEMGVEKISTTKGGFTELLGAHIYNNQSLSKTDPLFTVTDASASFVCVRETCFNSATYTMQVRETRAGVTKTFRDNTDRAFALYSAADSLYQPPDVMGVHDAGRWRMTPVRTAPEVSTPGLEEVYDCRGARVGESGFHARGVHFVRTPAGTQRLVIVGDAHRRGGKSPTR